MSAKFWDERYRSDDFAYGREPNDLLRAEAHRIPTGPVLCLAEGEGRNAVFLAERGHAVTAVDFSAEGLHKTERLARERGVNVTIVHADLSEFVPVVGGFAGVVAIWAHVPPEIRERMHAWVTQALRPGGVFILEAYTPDQLALGTGGPRDPELLMTLAELRAELAPLHFEIGREVRRDIHEGAFHAGPSATVQVVALRRTP